MAKLPAPAVRPAADYAAARAGFAWNLPARFNIGDACSTRHAAAAPKAPAIVIEDDKGRVTTVDFRALDRKVNRLANVLTGLRLKRGDRVAVLLPQALETAYAHLAAYKAGMIAVPLFQLFGPEALAYRLGDSGAAAIVTDDEGAAKLAGLDLPALKHVLITGRKLDALMTRAKDRFASVDTAADDPAVIIYTSGTTGPPKGALHAHRVLLGHLPGVCLPHDFFPQAGDRFWTPADWAWIGGLYDVLFPALFHGVAVVARRMRKFDPDAAMDLMARHRVRNVFFPPTALKLMRQAATKARADVRPRSIGSGGETLGEELLEWGRGTFGVTINEFYGQTECNLVVANCAALMPVKAGSMGRAVPGHVVGIVDDSGHELPDGQQGEIAVKRPDPVMFLGYWNNPRATAAKFRGDWLLTGDLGRRDGEGYLRYVGRADDVITSGGYRIGPAEIEDCLLRHPAIAMAAAIGVPDPLRTEIIKAFVVLKPGHAGDAILKRAIQDHVRNRLAAHEYPRLVEFVAELPLTATGKIMRRELRARGTPKESR